jgi:hypothetical protein
VRDGSEIFIEFGAHSSKSTWLKIENVRMFQCRIIYLVPKLVKTISLVSCEYKYIQNCLSCIVAVKVSSVLEIGAV